MFIACAVMLTYFVRDVENDDYRLLFLLSARLIHVAGGIMFLGSLSVYA